MIRRQAGTADLAVHDTGRHPPTHLPPLASQGPGWPASAGPVADTHPRPVRRGSSAVGRSVAGVGSPQDRPDCRLFADEWGE